MTQWDNDENDTPEGLDDDELPDPADIDKDLDDPTVPCPLCGKAIHEDSEICHHCGQYIVPQESHPGWIFWTTTILLALGAAVVFWTMWLKR